MSERLQWVCDAIRNGPGKEKSLLLQIIRFWLWWKIYAVTIAVFSTIIILGYLFPESETIYFGLFAGYVLHDVMDWMDNWDGGDE